MSYELVKAMTCNKKNGTIKIKSASSNVLPRKYKWWTFAECENEDEYIKSLRDFAGYICSGEIAFSPRCESKAHEAAYKAEDAIGNRDDIEYGEYERRYADEFIKAMDSPRDKSDYILIEDRGGACDVSYTSRDYWVNTVKYNCFVSEDTAERIGYIKMKAITTATFSGAHFTAKKIA